METLSATSGLPHVMVRRNMAKIHDALANMRPMLNGLTRGLDRRFSTAASASNLARGSVFIRPRQCLGPGHAEQFAGRQFALAAGHPAENPGRSSSRAARSRGRPSA